MKIMLEVALNAYLLPAYESIINNLDISLHTQRSPGGAINKYIYVPVLVAFYYTCSCQIHTLYTGLMDIFINSYTLHPHL